MSLGRFSCNGYSGLGNVSKACGISKALRSAKGRTPVLSYFCTLPTPVSDPYPIVVGVEAPTIANQSVGALALARGCCAQTLVHRTCRRSTRARIRGTDIRPIGDTALTYWKAAIACVRRAALWTQVGAGVQPLLQSGSGTAMYPSAQDCDSPQVSDAQQSLPSSLHCDRS